MLHGKKPRSVYNYLHYQHRCVFFLLRIHHFYFQSHYQTPCYDFLTLHFHYLIKQSVIAKVLLNALDLSHLILKIIIFHLKIAQGWSNSVDWASAVPPVLPRHLLHLSGMLLQTSLLCRFLLLFPMLIVARPSWTHKNDITIVTLTIHINNNIQHDFLSFPPYESYLPGMSFVLWQQLRYHRIHKILVRLFPYMNHQSYISFHIYEKWIHFLHFDTVRSIIVLDLNEQSIEQIVIYLIYLEMK